LPILGFALRAKHGERESTTKEVGVYQDEKLFAALQEKAGRRLPTMRKLKSLSNATNDVIQNKP